MIGYLRAFLPWIMFVAVGNHAPRVGALVAFALAAVLAIHSRQRGAAWDALVIELSSAVFFGGLAVAAYAVTEKPFGAYAAAVSAAWLAVTAWGSLALRRPFTLGIARGMTPPEVHNDPHFYRFSAVVTAVWASAFTVEAVAVAAVLAIAPDNLGALIAVKVACLGAPAVFTARFAALAAKRQNRLQQQVFPQHYSSP